MASKGSVYRRNGSWTAHLSWQTGGRQDQTKKGGYRTRKEAEAALVELAVQVQGGRYVPAARLTVGGYLDTWLDTLAVTGRRETTIRSYRWLVESHIAPELGTVPVKSLNAVDIDRLYATMSGKGLSLRTVRHCHSVLRKALADAVKKGLLPFNPADAASPPTTLATRAPETPIWTPEQLATFFGQIEGHHLAALVRVAAMTGMRRGELCGLRWADVDLERGTLNVRQTVVAVKGTPKVSEPKSEKSRRTIDLDAGTVATLRRYRVEQMELRMLCGPGWEDSGLVFTNPSGSAWHPDTITGTVQRMIDRSGLPRITLHGLRHSHLTHYLKATHDVKEASGRAGHASTSFTLDRYGHVLPGGQAEGAAAVAALVDGSGAGG